MGACRIVSQANDEASQGVRVGLQEIVRHGATLEHAEVLASAIASALRGEDVDAIALRQTFPTDIWGRSITTSR